MKRVFLFIILAIITNAIYAKNTTIITVINSSKQDISESSAYSCATPASATILKNNSVQFSIASSQMCILRLNYPKQYNFNIGVNSSGKIMTANCTPCCKLSGNTITLTCIKNP